MGKWRRQLAVAVSVGLVGGAVVLGTAPVARADSLSEDFESFALGSPDGQNGWQFTGSYDAAIADPNSFGVAGMGDRAFRISNAQTSGSFGDWVFSESLSDDAGEASAAGDGFSGGTRQSHYEASFSITSADQSAEQPGLQFSLAPDRGDGARMSFLRFNDTLGGIDVTFADYLDKHPQGPPGASGCGAEDEFATKVIATGLSRSDIHDVRITMDFLPGPANDRVEVFIDGTLVGSGTSWEDYFRYCEGNPTRPVDSLIFQARDGAGTAPGTLGEGFLIDGLSLSSGAIPEVSTPGSWELFPPQGQSYTTQVRPPINADGTSNWPKKRGVIPVQFDLSAATGPALLPAILSNNPGDTSDDFGFLKFTPDDPLRFDDLQSLSAAYEFLIGNCSGGAIRWQVRIDVGNDGNEANDGNVFIYYGDPPGFTDCTGANDQSNENMIGQSDVRYDLSQLGGPFYGTYAQAVGLVGTNTVLRASLVNDTFAGDKLVQVSGAEANGTTYTPLPAESPVKTCDLPPAEIKWTKDDPVPSGTVNEDAESIQNKDTGELYRVVDCKYLYNLDVGSLGPESGRAGTYYVYAEIGGQIVEAPATFDLR